MHEKHLARLEKVGLTTAEAQVYLALLHNGGSMGASAVVEATGVPRSSVYPTLSALEDRGLVEAEAGYGGRFSAVPVEAALQSLIKREKQQIAQREEIVGELTDELKSLTDGALCRGDTEQIQVLRDPRVVAERFDRLRLEAKRQIEVFVKAPIFAKPGDPVQREVLRRGVRVRGLYERAILDDPAIKPYLAKWISHGEEMRTYDGELPHKLAIIDGKNILLPLVTASGNGRILFVRHPQLGKSLEMFFDFLWERAEPISFSIRKRNGAVKSLPPDTNCRRSKSRRASVHEAKPAHNH